MYKLTLTANVRLASVELQSSALDKRTVCLGHVDPRCMKDSSWPFYCSRGIGTAVCSMGSHLYRVFIYDARCFLSFLAFSLRPQPSTAAACYVISRLELPSRVVGHVGILSKHDKVVGKVGFSF